MEVLFFQMEILFFRRHNDVVVSASGFEQDLVDAPASISIITKEELEKSQLRI